MTYQLQTSDVSLMDRSQNDIWSWLDCRNMKSAVRDHKNIKSFSVIENALTPEEKPELDFKLLLYSFFLFPVVHLYI